MDPRRPRVDKQEAAPAAEPATPAAPAQIRPPASAIPDGPLPSAVAAAAVAAPSAGATVIPAEIPQYYLPVRGELQAGGQMIYQSGVLAAATVGFVSTGTGVSTSNRIRRFVAAPESALAIDWEKATALEATLEELDRQPHSGASFADVPPAMAKVASYRSWGTDFSDWAFRTQTMEVFKSATFKATSNPGESEEDFRGRLQAAADDKKKTATEALQKKYEAKKATVEGQVLRAEQKKAREAEQSRGRKMQTAISFGATVLSVLVGSKKFGTGTLGRATTTMRDVGRSIDEGGDVKRADENLNVTKQKLADMETDLQAEIAALEAGLDPKSEALEKMIVRPRKSDITVDALGLVWMPYWKDASGALTGAWG